MKQSFWEGKIPNIAGYFMLIGILFLTTVIVKSGVLFPVRATPSAAPQNVQVSNLNETSFTITYTTAEATTGTLIYGDTPLYSNIVRDVRDTTEAQSHTVHFFTLSNLKPQTKYYFGIVSGTVTFTNNGKPYEVLTVPAATGSATIKGIGLMADGSYPPESYAIITIDQHQPVSTLLQPNGEYSITKLSGEPSTPVTIVLQTNTLTTTAKTTLGKTNPVPNMHFSQTYDFSISAPETAAEPTGQSFLTFPESGTVSTEPQILTPETDEKLSDLQPKFSGTALPGQTVEITIHSEEEIKASVKVNKNGTWSYRPATQLTPGEHTVQITTKDESGLLRTLTRPFVVYAQGSQFTEPSVAPEKTPTPSPTQIPTNTPIVTRQPTATASPTIRPTVSVTITPTTQPTLMATIKPTVLPTRYITLRPTVIGTPPTEKLGSEFAVFAGIAGVAIITGSVLFFTTQILF